MMRKYTLQNESKQSWYNYINLKKVEIRRDKIETFHNYTIFG